MVVEIKTMNFSFHDIVKMKIIQNDEGLINSLAKRILSTIDIEYDAFRVSDVKNPDITVVIGRFTPKNSKCYLIDHKYHIRKDYIYFDETSPNGAKWETEITGFEGKSINVKLNCKNKRAYMVILGYVVEFLIGYMLLLKGYSLVHAAGVTKDGRAYVFPARGSAGKTTLALNLVYKGYGYLGDDYVILNKDKALSYGTWLHVFNYHLKHKTKIFNDKLSTFQRMDIKLRYVFYLLTKKKFLYRIRIKDIIPDAEMKDGSSLGSMIFLVRRNGIRQPTFRKIGIKDAVGRLVSDMKLECYFSTRYYMDAYAFVFPRSKMATHWNRLENYYEKNLKGMDFRMIETPNYTEGVIERIYKFVEGLK
jgi:hypothetical protein